MGSLDGRTVVSLLVIGSGLLLLGLVTVQLQQQSPTQPKALRQIRSVLNSARQTPLAKTALTSTGSHDAVDTQVPEWHLLLVLTGEQQAKQAEAWRCAAAFQGMSIDIVLPSALKTMLLSIGRYAVLVRSDVTLKWNLAKELSTAFTALPSPVDGVSDLVGLAQTCTRFDEDKVGGLLLRKHHNADDTLAESLTRLMVTESTAAVVHNNQLRVVPGSLNAMKCQAQTARGQDLYPMTTPMVTAPLVHANFTARCNFRGRLANNMFQYSFCRIFAEKHRIGFYMKVMTKAKFQQAFPSATALENTNVGAKQLLLDGYFQTYAFYRYDTICMHLSPN